MLIADRPYLAWYVAVNEFCRHTPALGMRGLKGQLSNRYNRYIASRRVKGTEVTYEVTEFIDADEARRSVIHTFTEAELWAMASSSSEKPNGTNPS